MHQLVQDYLNKKEKESIERSRKEKNDLLIKLGLYEKVYSEKNLYSSEYPEREWDAKSDSNRYFKKVPVEVSDSEYAEILKYQKDTSGTNNDQTVSYTNSLSTAFKALAWIIFIGGFISGIVFGRVEVTKGYYYTYNETEFSFTLALIYWAASFIGGMFFLGFSEIIRLLTDIKHKH